MYTKEGPKDQTNELDVQAKYWIEPSGKWYNTPWLLLNVSAPLKRLDVFTDLNGTVWRQYYFSDGQHFLVNNRTGKSVARRKGAEYRAYSCISNGTSAGYLLHFSDYDWLKKPSSEPPKRINTSPPRVIIRPLSNWKANSVWVGSNWAFLSTNAHRTEVTFGKDNSAGRQATDLLVNLPYGFIWKSKVYLLTPPFTRQVLIFPYRPESLRWKVGKSAAPLPVNSKPWTTFFQCSSQQFSSEGHVSQGEYLEVAALKVDNRITTGECWSVTIAYLVGIGIVLGVGYLLYSCGNHNKAVKVLKRPRAHAATEQDHKRKIQTATKTPKANRSTSSVSTPTGSAISKGSMQSNTAPAGPEMSFSGSLQATSNSIQILGSSTSSSV